MFDLEASIVQWRRQMLAAGINSPVPLEELESHLRDDVDRQVRSGQDAQEAFATAVARIGHATAIRDEFNKTEGTAMHDRKRLFSLGDPGSAGFYSAIPPGIATLRKFAALPYLAAVLCFYLPFFEVSIGQLGDFSTAPTGQRIAYGGEIKWYDAPSGGVAPGHQNPNLLGISVLTLAFVALLLSLIRRPTTRKLSGWVGLGGASALWWLRDSYETDAAFQLFGAMHVQMREGFCLALLCLVTGAALQLKLVRWEQFAISPDDVKSWKPRRKSWRRILTEILAVFSLVLLATGLWLFVSPDEPPPDVSDLAAKPLQLTNDQNACAIIMQAAALVNADLFKANSEQLNNMTKGKNWDGALARQMLDGTDPIWSLWEQAAHTPQGQVPLVPTNLGPIQNLAKLAQIRVWDLARSGQPDAAIESLFTTLQVGQRLEQSRGDIIWYIVASGFRGSVLNSLRGITTEFKPSAATLRKALQQVEAYRPDKDAFANVLRKDFRSFRHDLESPESPLSSGDNDAESPLVIKVGTHVPYFFHPFQTLRIYADATRHAIGVIDLHPGYPGYLRPVDNLTKLLNGHHGNLLGVMLLDAHISMGVSFELDSRLRDQSRVSANEAYLALGLYQREHGELPATLDALVPDYLPAVPRDYFDGAPIRYSRDFRAVWSVGSNHFTVTSADLDPEMIAHNVDEVCFPLDFAAPAADPKPAPATLSLP